MTDPTQTPPAQLNATWKTVITIMTLIGNGVIILALIKWGDTHNDIHKTALTGSYITNLAILAGVGIGSLDIGKLFTGK